MVTVNNLSWHGITLQEIYGINSVQIPEGYEYYGFYPPGKGEKFIIPPLNDAARDRHFSVGVWEPSNCSPTPRIIVWKTEDYLLPYKKCFIKTWTIKDIYGVEDPAIPEGYEVEEFRPVTQKEIYLVQSGGIGFWDIIPPSAHPFIILREKKKKLYAKIPLTDFKSGTFHNRVKFKTVDNYDFEVDIAKQVEIIEE